MGWECLRASRDGTDDREAMQTERKKGNETKTQNGHAIINENVLLAMRVKTNIRMYILHGNIHNDHADMNRL